MWVRRALNIQKRRFPARAVPLEGSRSPQQTERRLRLARFLSEAHLGLSPALAPEPEPEEEQLTRS